MSCCVVGCLFLSGEKRTRFVKKARQGLFSWFVTGLQRFLPQAEQQILLEGVGPLVGEGVALLAAGTPAEATGLQNVLAQALIQRRTELGALLGNTDKPGEGAMLFR